MPSPQEDQLNANLDLLLALQFEGMSPQEQADLQTDINQIKADYQTTIAKGKVDKYYKDLGDAIAKSVPAMVKGAFTAAAAFKNGDYISGAAAMMDICSSIIPVFAAILSSTGPQGALIGALFSVIGQILSFFAPKQPSLEDKIQKMLDHLQSEQNFQEITAFGHSVSSYTLQIRDKSAGQHKMLKPVTLAGTVSLTKNSTAVTGSGTSFLNTVRVGQWILFAADTDQKVYGVEAIASNTSLTLATPYAGTVAAASNASYVQRDTIRRSIAEILAMPLNAPDDADSFLAEMKALRWGLERSQAKLDVPVFANWKVAAYLERVENQAKEGWQEVLGVWCRAYVDLITANMILDCLADPETIARRLIETQPGAKSALPDDSRSECHKALIKLKALTMELSRSWESDKKEMTKIVNALREPARQRGTYAHLGSWNDSLVLYIATGKGNTSSLQWDYKKNTAWLSKLSLHLPKSQADSFVPKYDLLVLQYNKRNITRHTIDSVNGDLSNGTDVVVARENETYRDLCGIPFHDPTVGVDSSAHPLTFISLAGFFGKHDHVNVYTANKEQKSVRVNWEPPLPGQADTRILYLPPTTLSDDPDADAMRDDTGNPPGRRLLAQDNPVLYGGVRNVNHIHVVAWNSWETVAGPENWTSYNGIEVDPYYIWVFGKGGIACATHASMIKARQKKVKPSWIYHDFPKDMKTPEVVWLSPAADGTLLVAVPGEIYTADYTIDRKAHHVITSEWVKRGGNATQVVKMPIPCWSMLESLTTHLHNG